MQDGVKVAGLAQLRKELKRLDDKGLSDELKDANYDVASHVVTLAKARATGVSKQAARAAESLRASRTAARAQVLLGSGRIRFAFGAEFGSSRFKQFPAWRGNGTDAGYFLYPTIRDEIPEIVETYGDAIERITAKAFPD
jgi:hypothetical protein